LRKNFKNIRTQLYLKIENNMKKALYTSYYITLLLVVIGLVGMSLLAGGQQVGFGKQVARLESERRQLQQQQLTLRQQLNEHQSLAVASQFATERGFQPLTKPASISMMTSVASR
jgi:hypothetical protein